MAIVAYYRVSTGKQSTDSQKVSIEKKYNIDKSFEDVCSGTVKSANREGFQACMNYLREGDQLIVWDLDRLGRDSIDMQLTIQALKDKNVGLTIESLGVDLNSDVGEIIAVFMSKMAEIERKKILARTAAGRKAAIESGVVMGRPQKVSIDDVARLRNEGKSINETAKLLECSSSTVKTLTVKAKNAGLINEDAIQHPIKKVAAKSDKKPAKAKTKVAKSDKKPTKAKTKVAKSDKKPTKGRTGNSALIEME